MTLLRIGGLIDEILDIGRDCAVEEESVVLANLAVALAKKNQIERAREIIASIPHAYTRAFACVRLFDITRSQGDIAAAEKNIDDGLLTIEEKICVGAKIAEALADQERAAYVSGLAQAVDSGKNHRGIQRFVTRMLSNTGNVLLARASAEKISDPMIRSIAFAEIATATGDPVDLSQVKSRSFLVNIYLGRNEIEQARGVARGSPDDRARVRLFLAIAVTSHEVQDLHEAMEAAERVPDLKLNPLILCEIGISSAKTGDPQNARKIATALAAMTTYKKRRWLQGKVLTAILEEMP